MLYKKETNIHEIIFFYQGVNKKKKRTERWTKKMFNVEFDESHD